MTGQITIEVSARESRWEKVKTQLQFLASVFDYDPLEDTHQRTKLMNTEVSRLRSRIEALELQLSSPTANLD